MEAAADLTHQGHYTEMVSVLVHSFRTVFYTDGYSNTTFNTCKKPCEERRSFILVQSKLCGGPMN